MQPTTQDIFFSVLRSSIFGEPLSISPLKGRELTESNYTDNNGFRERSEQEELIPDGYDWTEVIGMFQEQALIGLVASTIMHLPSSKKPQTLEMQDMLLSSYTMHMRARDRIQKTIITVFDLLEKNGIKAILMKGESMVRFYPKNCQRGIGDIDLLVPQERYHEAVKILQQLSGDMGHEDSMERHYKIEYNGFTLEIHQRPIWCANSTHKKAFQRLSQKYVDPDKCDIIQLQGKDIRVFPMQYNVLFIFNHLLEHLRDGGIGFKQIIDFTLLLNSIVKSNDTSQRLYDTEHSSYDTLRYDNFSYGVLERELKTSGLLRAWKVLGGIVVKNLGLPEEKFPFYDERLAEKSQGEILQRIIKGGLFGWKLHQQQNKEHIAPLRVLHNIWFVIKDTRYLWTLFPDGALGSSWGIIKGSLLHHAGITKCNTVFED